MKEQLLLTTRVVSAAVGGYALAAIISLWLAYFANLEPRDHRFLVNISFFLIYLLLILAAFGFRSHLKTAFAIAASNVVLWVGWFAIQGGVTA
ncbi:hypothetical protein [Pseudidiomarina sp.]|uniref:hypothetical protein n=1 Tax=Pseudidiomarina sp. TaxID=2081707 RepID=UPI003A97702D